MMAFIRLAWLKVKISLLSLVLRPWLAKKRKVLDSSTQLISMEQSMK